ncbi:glycosyltransferase family 4 protein [Ferribacterium limneticum]|uniref:glycosyltransferase family 4 protein n=1 Tax=Ferribacterium limneticum TaxID=76259 RepID=UPI001CFBD00E|nr:glycosyltransferase family 1 protein [Ferribacterium limneticum]UCV20763.1 glycosyltransferase family 4 protein [Ferribacterium limneticum]
MLIDITRLADRFLQNRLPTGVDRVSLRYLRRFIDRSYALIRFAGRWVELNRRDSRRVFEVLLDGVSDEGSVIRRCVAQAYVLSWRSRHCGVLFNTGHSGLDRPDYGVEVVKRCLKPVFFLHDLIPISHPEYCRAGETARHHRRLETMLSTGKCLIVNSQATRDELMAYARERGIDVPPCAVASLAPARLPAPFHGRPEKRPYFVILGTIEPRKNHSLLLHLWRQLVAEFGEAAPKLVVIGQRGWECEQVVDLLDRCAALQGHVIELPRCEDRELSTWLAHAQALLFPSFIEGFGMPLVEALMLGVPVIASDLPVFREIAGDIPLYLDPLDGPGWRRAVLEFVRPDSIERQTQIERIESYAPPTWEQHFAVVEDLLREIDVSG